MLRPLRAAPAEANLATCGPREPPATMRCRYGFPAPSALQGCFLNLPTEAFDEAFSSSGLLTTEPCATVTTMPSVQCFTGSLHVGEELAQLLVASPPVAGPALIDGVIYLETMLQRR